MSTFSQEKVMATHSSILAWRIPMDKGAWQSTYSPLCHKESDMTVRLNTHTHTHTHTHTLFLNADTGSGNGRNLLLAVWDKMQKVGFCRTTGTSPPGFESSLFPQGEEEWLITYFFFSCPKLLWEFFVPESIL